MKAYTFAYRRLQLLPLEAWILIAFSLASISIHFIDINTLVDWGIRISPTEELQDKTVLLLKSLRVVLPLLGLTGFGWLLLPHRTREAIREPLRTALGRQPWPLLTVLALSALVRVWWVMYFPTQPYADSAWYFEKGVDISRGHGYIYDRISREPTAAWPVGYPTFLGALFLLTGPSQLAAKFANVALSAVLVFLSYLLGKRVFSQEAGILTAVQIALLPGIFVYASLLNSDLLYATLFLAVFVLALTARSSLPPALRGWAPWIAGLLNGAAILTRSIGLLFLPFWLLIGWFHDRGGNRGRWVLLFSVGTLLLLTPWTVRNYVHFSRWVPVATNGGANLWIGNHPGATGGYHYPLDESNPLLPLIGDEFAVNERGIQASLQFISENPLTVLRLLPYKVFYLFNANDFGLEWNNASATEAGRVGTSIRAHALANLLYFLCAILGLFGTFSLFFHPDRTRPIAWVGLVACLYWTLIHLPFFGSNRFVLPLLPILGIYASRGFLTILQLRLR